MADTLINSLLSSPKESIIRILIVEDDPLQQEFFSRCIRQLANIDVASTGREALSKIKDTDILVLDWRLHTGNTRVIFDAWIDRGNGPCTIISGYLTDELRTELITEGAYNALPKPVSPELLIRLITRYINLVKQSKELTQTRQELHTLKRIVLITLIITLFSLITNGSEILLGLFT